MASIDGVSAETVYYKGKKILVVPAWNIVVGRGWIEKTAEWANRVVAGHFEFTEDGGLKV